MAGDNTKGSPDPIPDDSHPGRRASNDRPENGEQGNNSSSGPNLIRQRWKDSETGTEDNRGAQQASHDSSASMESDLPPATERQGLEQAASCKPTDETSTLRWVPGARWTFEALTARSARILQGEDKATIFREIYDEIIGKTQAEIEKLQRRMRELAAAVTPEKNLAEMGELAGQFITARGMLAKFETFLGEITDEKYQVEFRQMMKPTFLGEDAWFGGAIGNELASPPQEGPEAVRPFDNDTDLQFKHILRAAFPDGLPPAIEP